MKIRLLVISMGMLGLTLNAHTPNQKNTRYCTQQSAKTTLIKKETPMEVEKVYKLLNETQWKKFHEDGEFYGSPVDLKDGFIHLSKPSQVARVKDKYYKDVRPLYIVEFQGKDWLKTLIWEKASNGDLYPHLYDEPLKFEHVYMIEICR